MIARIPAPRAAFEGRPFPLNALYGTAGTWGAFAAGYLKAMDDGQ
jgi:hypothetical protein